MLQSINSRINEKVQKNIVVNNIRKSEKYVKKFSIHLKFLTEKGSSVSEEMFLPNYC